MEAINLISEYNSKDYILPIVSLLTVNIGVFGKEFLFLLLFDPIEWSEGGKAGREPRRRRYTLHQRQEKHRLRMRTVVGLPFRSWQSGPEFCEFK